MNNKYAKTDINFSTARSVLRAAYIVIEGLCLLGMGIGVIVLIMGNLAGGFSAIFSCLLGALFINLIYAFNIGFFELIKHAREIRDELVDMRTRGGMPDRTSSAQSNVTGINGGMRYDSTTHQYVKA